MITLFQLSVNWLNSLISGSL